MFSTAVRGGKGFAAEQKIRELKKRISRLLALGKNIKAKKRPNEVISKATDNMNSIPTSKYGLPPNIVEKNLFLLKGRENGLILKDKGSFQSSYQIR